MCDVKRAMAQTLTVGQLREMLEDYDENTPVFLGAEYGDYHHTVQALTITEVVEASEGQLAESGYSRSRVAFIGEGSDEGESYCDECNEMLDGYEICPKCGGVCVNENGEPFQKVSGERVLILK